MEGRHAGLDVRERERRETFLRSPRDSNSGAGLGVPNEQEQRRGGKTAVGGRREDQSLQQELLRPHRLYLDCQMRLDGFSSKTAFLSLGLKFRVSLRMLCLLGETGKRTNEIAI